MYEPRHEKTYFLQALSAETKAQISCAVTKANDLHLCFRYIDSAIPLT